MKASSLSSIDSFFYSDSLEYIDLSNFDGSSLYSLSYLFKGFSSLKYVDLSNFYAPIAESMSNMFYGCHS